METNITGRIPAPVPVEQLVETHIGAVADHDRLFQLQEWGLVDEKDVLRSIGPINDALFALCAARPAAAPQIELRRSYLEAVLPDAVYSDTERSRRAVHLLLAGETENSRN